MINAVFEKGIKLVLELKNTQSDNLDCAAKQFANAFLRHKKVFVTGSGHSHTMAEEFYSRAGGLAFVVPILTPELTITDHPTKSSYIERLPGYARILAELYHISDGDVVLIASNSGRNAYPVEMALSAKERGATVIAVTNVRHSSATVSRDPSGKRLMDIADIVIDNCGEIGDACLALEGMETKVFSTSSIVNAFIAQAISVQTAAYIKAAGIEPPVFASMNVDGAEKVNDEYYKKYTRLY